MAAFYGRPPEELDELPTDEYSSRLNSMRILKAREQLMAFRIACSPNMKESQREKLLLQIKKIAFPEISKPRPITEEMLELING